MLKRSFQRQSRPQRFFAWTNLKELLFNQRFLQECKSGGSCHQFTTCIGLRFSRMIVGCVTNLAAFFFLLFSGYASNGCRSLRRCQTSSSVREYYIKPPGKTGHKSSNSFEYIFGWCQLINNSFKKPRLHHPLSRITAPL